MTDGLDDKNPDPSAVTPGGMGSAAGPGSGRPRGTVILLIAAEGSSRSWAAATATEFCERWSRDGRRIVLADLHLEEPLLHDGFEVANLEGVVDIFLYGASISRIAQPVRDGAFYLLPAGTYTPDIAEIYQHPRWKKLIAGFRETQATLVLFAPENGVDLDQVARWSEEVVILGSEGGSPLENAAGAAGFTVIDRAAEMGTAAVTIPDPLAPADVPDTREELQPAEVVSSYVEPRRNVPLHRPPESDLELPPPPLRRQGEKRTSTMLLWLLFLILLAGAAGYAFARMRPDLLRRILPQEPTGAVATSVEVPAEPELPEGLGELLPYSVQVKAFSSLSAARDDLEGQQRRLTGVPFFISPEEIQGILYYRILAGFETDTLSATRLRDRLVDEGAIENEDAVGALSLVQFTPLTFSFGEFPSPDSARTAADALLSRDIPSYLTPVDYSDGSRRWQLYAGAYPDSAGAMSMREMLDEAGIDASLTARTGTPVPPTE